MSLRCRPRRRRRRDDNGEGTDGGDDDDKGEYAIKDQMERLRWFFGGKHLSGCDKFVCWRTVS